MKRPTVILAALALALLAWLLWPKSPPSAASPTPVSQPSTLNSQLSPASPFPLNASTTDIVADLHLLADTFESFRTNFPGTGNPVGENAEITAALTGKNPLHLALIPRDHSALNARGELCDRWGTPFFFHQLSGTQMEIRSAGPDKIFHTPDDTVLTP